MARKKNKGSPAQNADSPSVPRSQKPRASRSQAQGPQPKPAAAKTSIKKTEQRPKAEPKPTSVPAPNRPSSAPKTGVKPNKAGKTAAKPDKSTKDTSGQARPSQKKRQPNMANRKNNQNRPAPAHNVQTAQLELPEGYTPPGQPAKKNQRQRRNRGNTLPQTPGTESPATLPWVLNPKYPKPLNGFGARNFNYERPAWISLFGLDVEAEMNRQFLRNLNLQFRRPYFQIKGQLKELHNQYWSRGETEPPELFRAKKKLARIGKPISGNLFLATSPAEDGDESKSILVRLLKTTELGTMIIELLIPSMGDLSAVAMTCKDARACMRRYFDVWDFRSGEFDTDHYLKKLDANNRLVQEGGVRINTLIISPVSDEPEGLQEPCMADFKHMMKLCGAITKIPSTFRSIVLDQVPFFDVKMFELMIKTMPSLETVTITRCILLDITKLPPLLAAIKRHPRVMKTRRTHPMFDESWARKLAQILRNTPITSGRRITPALEAQAQGVATPENPTDEKPKREDEDFVCLDFFPFFFHGPQSGPRLGSYGVTHNEPTFNAPKAVFALILQCWDLAQEVGMDMVGDSSSFWRFVRQLPGPDALWAMKAREALLTREYEKITLPARHQQMVQERFADDLTAALTGDNQSHPVAPPGMRIYRSPDYVDYGEYWRLQAKCAICKFTYPVSLFPLTRDACWSCKMTTFVAYMEDSHLRLWQGSALSTLRRGLDLRSTNLHMFLSHAGKQVLEKAMDDVRVAGFVRQYFLNLPTRAGPNPNAPLSADDWDTVVPTGVLHCPPHPRRLNPNLASMVRWRWNRAEATQAFDCRQGGPQWAHPCKNPASAGDYGDAQSGGAETKEQFAKKWEWTRVSDELFITRYLKVHEEERRSQTSFHKRLPEINDRDDPRVLAALKDSRRKPDWRDYIMTLEWCEQNKIDKQTYREQYSKLQVLLHSMSTPLRKPFNLDSPLPDPGVNKQAYKELMEKAKMLPPYNHSRTSFHR